MSRLPSGRFWPVASFWHRRGPLAKLVLLSCLAAAAVGSPGIAAQLLLAAVVAALWATARLPGRLLLGVVRSFAWLIALTLLANLFLAANPGGGISWPPHPTRAAALGAVLSAWRLFALFVLGAWLTATTSPVAMTGAVRGALAPLGRLGLPVGDLALVMGLGLHLLPEMLEAGGRIRLAQRARGVGAARGWRESLRALEALTFSLFSLAFRRADELAVAMEARGYQSGRGPRRIRRRPADRLDLLVILGGVGLAWALLRFGG